MKIMIVDDEVIIREGLSKVIDWQQLGLSLLEPAESAEQALERIPEERPDLLLTDIRMDGKDGLVLADEAKRILPDLEIIILTGYDDFAYAQRAIRQNVCDYLLKSSRPEEIIQAVLSAVQRISTKLDAKSKDFIKEKEIYSHMFEKWVLTGESVSDHEWLYKYLPKLERQLPEEKELRLQVILVKPVGWGDTESSAKLLLFAVENILRELVPCETLVINHFVVAAMKINPQGTAEDPHRSLIFQIEKLLKCTLYSSAGIPVEIPEELSQSYRMAVQVSGYWEVFTEERNLTYGKIKERKGGRTVCSHQEEVELSGILLSGDIFRLNQWINAVCAERMSHPDVSYLSYVQSIALAGFRWLERVAGETGEWKEKIGWYTAFGAGEEIPQRERLKQYMQSIMKAYLEHQVKGKPTYIHRAVAFIKENLGNNQLSLAQTARYVSVHPGHLSEVFKRETGFTFGDYVTRERMAKAREMLMDPSIKIGEVAHSLGYEDVKYFSQLFKKHYKQTPSEYREKIAVK